MHYICDVGGVGLVVIFEFVLWMKMVQKKIMNVKRFSTVNPGSAWFVMLHIPAKGTCSSWSSKKRGWFDFCCSYTLC